jgi:hypothetical protein
MKHKLSQHNIWYMTEKYNAKEHLEESVDFHSQLSPFSLEVVANQA